MSPKPKKPTPETPEKPVIRQAKGLSGSPRRSGSGPLSELGGQQGLQKGREKMPSARGGERSLTTISPRHDAEEFDESDGSEEDEQVGGEPEEGYDASSAFLEDTSEQPLGGFGEIDEEPAAEDRRVALVHAGEGVTALDPLKRYLQEISQISLLSPEEEFSLAVALRDQGDLAAAKKLVSANLRLVVKIAMEYRTAHGNLLDLIQEGNVGLMKAVSKFDPAKGAKLSYYASWWIRSYILKYVLDNFRLVKMGTTQAQKKLFYQLVREKERLEAQGIHAGPQLLADRLHVKEKDVVEMDLRLSHAGAESSLQAPLHRDGEGGRGAIQQDTLVDGQELADDQLVRAELLKKLEEKLPLVEPHLSQRERVILQERVLAEEPKTLQEVADIFGMTRERVRQIEAKVIQKFRDAMGSDGLVETSGRKDTKEP